MDGGADVGGSVEDTTGADNGGSFGVLGNDDNDTGYHYNFDTGNFEPNNSGGYHYNFDTGNFERGSREPRFDYSGDVTSGESGGSSWVGTALGTASYIVNTAALVTLLGGQPELAGPLKFIGIVLSVAAVGNAVYEYHQGQISSAELATTVGMEAANFACGYASRPIEAFVATMTWAAGVVDLTSDFADIINEQQRKN